MPKQTPADPAAGPDAAAACGDTTATCPLPKTWVWDEPHTGDRDRFVNLPNAWDPANNGAEVELVGHVEPRVSGETVTFNIVSHADNYLEGQTASLSTVSITSGAKGVGKVTLTLPAYGGSKWKVGGKTSTMAAPAQCGQLTVWRKVYYQTTDMDSSPAPENLSLTHPSDMISALQSAFDPVFFKLAAGTKSTATTPYQAHLTADQRTSLEASLKTAAADDRSPFKMNIITCDRADIVAENEYLAAATSAHVETVYFQKWTHETTVIHAEYQKADGSWSNLSGVATPADPSNAANQRVTATIPGFTAGATVNIRIKYRYQRGNAGGWGGRSGGLFMCIGRQRRGSATSPTGAELQQALTHEIGHNLGLVPAAAAWRDTAARDAPYSVKHCGYKDAAPSTEPRCVMWFMLGGSGARLRFCASDKPDDCSHFLMRTAYTSLSWI
jgi:hypothetical protein